MNNNAFFRLQQLISPSLPIGAFTYSQGMEWAVECGWIKNADDLHCWLESLLQSSVQTLELPVLARLHHASCHQDREAFTHWAHTLLAWRETRELRTEECQRGHALTMVLDRLPDAANWPELQQPEWRHALAQTQLAGFALASARWDIELQQALNGYLWSWLENMVIVAVKLIPLGQSDGQRELYRFSDQLAAITQHALAMDDDDIGSSSPAMAIASCLHETQYCRLFRS